MSVRLAGAVYREGSAERQPAHLRIRNLTDGTWPNSSRSAHSYRIRPISKAAAERGCGRTLSRTSFDALLRGCGIPVLGPARTLNRRRVGPARAAGSTVPDPTASHVALGRRLFQGAGSFPASEIFVARVDHPFHCGGLGGVQRQLLCPGIRDP
jgi:hypothetical protein